MTKKNGLVLALSWAIVGSIMTVGCGGENASPQNACTVSDTEQSSASLNCVMPSDTRTTTSTVTGTGGTTPPATGGTGGSSTATTTSTSTNTAVTPFPEWCNAYAGPGNRSEDGGPLSLGFVSNGSWHVANTLGEWIANCKVDAIGNAVCCGTLTTEVNNAMSQYLTTWTGMATEKCVFWTPNNKTAPTISGIGYTVSSSRDRVDLIGSSPPAWEIYNKIQIAGCPGFQM